MSRDRDCLSGYEWCDGPDGVRLGDEAFGGLCDACFVRQVREQQNDFGGAGSE